MPKGAVFPPPLSCQAVWSFAYRQLAEAPEGGKGKKGKAKRGKGKKGEKEDKGKGKEKGKEKGKKETDDGEGAEASVIQAVGKHFSLDLAQEQHRAVACLLADHELQVALHLLLPPPNLCELCLLQDVIRPVGRWKHPNLFVLSPCSEATQTWQKLRLCCTSLN